MAIQGKNTKYRIRLAEIEDLPALLAIEKKAGEKYIEFGLAYLENITLPIETLVEAQGDGRVWVITTLVGEMVGFAVVSTDNEQLHLEEIDIEQAHGRQGLGKALINAICDWAKTAGFKTMSLSTFRDIPWNAPYYERLGFRIVPESEFTEYFLEIQETEEKLGLPNSQRVIMCKNL